jgi:hypothetical protein
LNIPAISVSGTVQIGSNELILNSSLQLARPLLTGSLAPSIIASGNAPLPLMDVSGFIQSLLTFNGTVQLPPIQTVGSFSEEPPPVNQDPVVVKSTATYDIVENMFCTVELKEGRLFVTLKLS